MQLTRRRLLATAAPAAALALAGCASGSGTTTSTWIAALEAIGTELASVLPLLQSSGAIPVAAISQATVIINDILSVLAAINSASTMLTGYSVLTQIEGYLNALASVIAPYLSLIPGVGTVVGLIVMALPAIELAVNLLVSLISPQLQALASAAPALPLSAKLRGANASQVSQVYEQLLIARAGALRASGRLGKRAH